MKYLLAIIIIFTCTPCRAQVNLVLNPSLEQYSACPFDYDEIKYADQWMSLDSSWSPPDWAHDPSGVPEYLNTCGSAAGGIPSNGYYFNYPRTGNGMAEVIMFCDENDPEGLYRRDYMQGHLSATLIAGQSYCVTFYVALEQASFYATNHIGAYLDNGTIDTTHNYEGVNSEFIPQILDTAVILDTNNISDPYWTWEGNWVKVQGSFIANGTERLITIANFSDKAHTNATAIKDTIGASVDSIDEYNWYLVDDISVIKGDAVANAGPDQVITGGIADSVIIGDTLDTYLPVYWYVNGSVIDSNKASLKVRPDTTTKYVMALDVCGNITYDTVVVWDESLNNVQVNKLANVQIFPNPATNQLNVEYAKGCELLMYDMVGKIAYQTFISSDKQVVDISLLQGGVYVVQVVDPLTMSRVIKKVIKE